MKTLVVNGNKYSCPEKWDEVTLRMQVKLTQDTDKIKDNGLKKLSILSGYAGIPLDELKRTKLNDLQELFSAIAFINEPMPETMITEFDFKGSHYHCGQNIVEMEFQDFVSIENTLQETSGNTTTALPIILAVMCKKKLPNGQLETIDDYDVIKRSEEFKDLPLTIANSLSLFFYHSEKVYTNLLGSYSNPNVMVESQIQEVEGMLKQLAGRGLFMRLLSGILRICLKSIRRKQRKLFTSIASK